MAKAPAVYVQGEQMSEIKAGKLQRLVCTHHESSVKMLTWTAVLLFCPVQVCNVDKRGLEKNPKIQDSKHTCHIRSKEVKHISWWHHQWKQWFLKTTTQSICGQFPSERRCITYCYFHSRHLWNPEKWENKMIRDYKSYKVNPTMAKRKSKPSQE